MTPELGGARVGGSGRAESMNIQEPTNVTVLPYMYDVYSALFLFDPSSTPPRAHGCAALGAAALGVSAVI
eukprot:1284509-Prymnesium_polylepis.2